MYPVPDLVHLSELEVEFSSDTQLTKHIYYISKPGQRKVRQEDHWTRQRELGRGGFGAVYLEQCVEGGKQGRIQAVKEIAKSTGSNYNRELEAIALFSHSKYEDYFVKSFGWYSTEDKIFITLEYLKYGDLQQYLVTPLPEQEAQQLLRQILEGLNFMHDKGFAHRDLKPANILVVRKGPDWWIKIADFGISKRATEGLTALRTMTGTPAFAAPEVLGLGDVDDSDDGTYTNAVDIWSAGVITFLVLTGETFYRDPRQLRQYARGKLDFPLEALLARSVSESGCTLTEICMAPKPQDRPGTKELLQHSWFINVDGPKGSSTESSLSIENLPQSTQSLLKPGSATLSISQEKDLTLRVRGGNNPGPSASWSTRKQDSSFTARLPSKSEPYNGRSAQDWQPDHTNSRDQGVIPDGQDTTAPSAPLVPNSNAQTQIHWSEVKELKGHSELVWGVAFSPDGRLVASGSADKTVRLWETGIGAEVKRLDGHGGWVRGVAFSPDGRLVASGSEDKTVRLWETGTGAEVKRLEGHRSWVYSVAFSLDGRLIASGSGDRTVTLWETGTGAKIMRLKGHSGDVNSVAFSPDGRLVASGSGDKTVRLWETGTGAEVKKLEGHRDWVWSVAFSPDGRLVASGSADKTVRLLETGTGAEVKRLEGHSGGVISVAFSPDGRLVASGSQDKTVRLWDWRAVAQSTPVVQEDDTIRGRLRKILRLESG